MTPVVWCFGTATPAAVLLHGAHHSLIIGGVVAVVWMLAPASWVDALRRGLGGPDAEAGVGWVALAVTGSAAAAVVHLAVVPGHLRAEAGPRMAPAFLAVAGLQAVAAYAISRAPGNPSRLAAAAALHVAALAAWLVSRTVGLPEAIHPGGRAAVGVPDLVAVTWQVLAVAALAVLLRRTSARRHHEAYAPMLARWSGWPPGARVQAATAGLSIVALVASGGLL